MFNIIKRHLSDIELEHTIEHFFNDNKLEKEQLRIFIQEELHKLRKIITNILYLKENEILWQQLHDKSAISEKPELVKASNAIQKIPIEIDFWEREGVESQERFEFFILSKAAELNSGDQNRDYYHAMLIRHDQLLAVTFVLKQSVKHLQNCLSIPYNEIIHSDDYKYFYARTTAERIYKMAEIIYKTRKRLGKL